MPMPDDLWDFADPALSEQRFRDLIAQSDNDPACRAEAHTQVARAQGLQRRYAEGHATLNDLESAAHPPAGRIAIRVALERGRLINSSGDPANSIAPFTVAWTLARESGEDALAVDAAHMLAIVSTGEAALLWHERAFSLARSSPDPAATDWIGSIANNLGWTLHDLGRAADALPVFQDALTWRESRSNPGPIRVARWTVARCLRTLNRLDEALAIQRSLAEELTERHETDPYVEEELGECLLALGRPSAAAPHFARAHTALMDDPWLVEHEPDRLSRLRSLAT